jgi:hypothetical protein
MEANKTTNNANTTNANNNKHENIDICLINEDKKTIFKSIKEIGHNLNKYLKGKITKDQIINKEIVTFPINIYDEPDVKILSWSDNALKQMLKLYYIIYNNLKIRNKKYKLSELDDHDHDYITIYSYSIIYNEKYNLVLFQGNDYTEYYINEEKNDLIIFNEIEYITNIYNEENDLKNINTDLIDTLKINEEPKHLNHIYIKYDKLSHPRRRKPLQININVLSDNTTYGSPDQVILNRFKNYCGSTFGYIRDFLQYIINQDYIGNIKPKFRYEINGLIGYNIEIKIDNDEITAKDQNNNIFKCFKYARYYYNVNEYNKIYKKIDIINKKMIDEKKSLKLISKITYDMDYPIIEILKNGNLERFNYLIPEYKPFIKNYNRIIEVTI